MSMTYSDNTLEKEHEFLAGFILLILMNSRAIGRNVYISHIYLPKTLCGLKRIGPRSKTTRRGEQMVIQEKGVKQMGEKE